MKHQSHAQPISTVPLNEQELQHLLDKLDAQAATPTIQQRVHKRISCRRTGMVVTVDQQGYESTFVIPVRNISSGGVAFLHRFMLHKGTTCTLRIRTPQSTWLKTSGKVVRSRQIDGGVCEIGVQFDSEVDVSAFEILDEATEDQAQT